MLLALESGHNDIAQLLFDNSAISASSGNASSSELLCLGFQVDAPPLIQA